MHFARYHTERFVSISAKLFIQYYHIRGFHNFVCVGSCQVNNYFLIQ